MKVVKTEERPIAGKDSVKYHFDDNSTVTVIYSEDGGNKIIWPYSQEQITAIFCYLNAR